MKKVLYLSTLSNTINAFLIPHIKMLIENKYLVDCACSIKMPIDNSLISKGVNVFDVPFCRNPLSVKNIKAFKEIIRIQKQNQYDIIHVHTPVASFYGRLLKIIFPKLKVIYTVHGYHFFKGSSKVSWLIYYPIEKLMAKLTDVTININHEDFQITIRKLRPKRCYLINGVGIELKEYAPLSEQDKILKRKELKLGKSDFVVIMIAELNKNKNQIQLIRAIELLKNNCPNIKVLIVGEGDKSMELQNEVKTKWLEEKIFFLGSRTDINELINISNIGVLLSYREGLPRSVMELMANGKKVIVTNIRGNNDLVCNENVGSLVEVGDYQTTAKLMENYYLRNDEEIIIPKEIELYSIEHILKELKLIYQCI